MGLDFGARGILVLILALAVYVPFEEFLLRWIPVSEPVYLLLRLVPELLIYSLLLLILAGKAFQPRATGINWIDLCIGAFLLLAVVSIILHGASWTNALVNLRTLLRYVAVFYIVSNLPVDRSTIRFVLTTIVLVAAVQALIALFGVMDPAAYSRYFLPRGAEVAFGDLHLGFDARRLEGSAVAGTMGRPAALALLMSAGLLVLVVVGHRIPGLRSALLRGLLMLLLAIGLYLSQKRGILISGLLVCALFGLIVARNQRVLTYLAFSSVFGMLLIFTIAPALNQNDLPGPLAGLHDADGAKRVSELFSAQYWEHSMRVSRGWFVTGVGGHVAGSKWALTGLSADEQHARNYLIREGSDFRRLDRFHAFKDVYWVAMFCFYGLAGLLLFWAILWHLCRLASRLSRAGTVDDRDLSRVLIGLIMIMILTGFIERSPEIRVFAFHTWLLAGMVLSRLRMNDGQWLDDRASDQLHHGRSGR
jgi:hypothetical protein